MPRPVRHQYFFAVVPAPVIARQIHSWAERTIGSQGLQEADRLHVTLAITDHFPSPLPELAAALSHAGSEVRADPFDLTLDRRSSSARSVALRPARAIKPLTALHGAIARAMRREGVGLRPGWRFNPHMTLAYRDDAPGAQTVHCVGWPVREFVLVHSLVNLHRHDILGRWPLKPLPEAQLSLFAA